MRYININVEMRVTLFINKMNLKLEIKNENQIA